MTPAKNVYTRLGVRTLINAQGTVTTVGGSLMPPEVVQAMTEAAGWFVSVPELQEKVGARIAGLLGVPAALVTAGAASAIAVGTAACMGRDDPEAIGRLPETGGLRDEVILQKAHKSRYEAQMAQTGAKVVWVETREELERAVGPRTAMMFFLNRFGPLGAIGRGEWLEVGKRRGVPTFLDAAADVPPVSRFSEYTREGFDLVTFSGGKAIRGPQASGLLLGRPDLIAAGLRAISPSMGIGRAMKVGKEEIVGLLAAVERYLALDHAAQRRERTETLERVAHHLQGLPSVRTEFVPNGDFSHSPRLSVQWDEKALNMSVGQMVAALRAGSPSIEASDLTEYQPAWKGLGILAHNLQPGEELIVARRVGEILTAAAKTRGLSR